MYAGRWHKGKAAPASDAGLQREGCEGKELLGAFEAVVSFQCGGGGTLRSGGGDLPVREVPDSVSAASGRSADRIAVLLGPGRGAGWCEFGDKTEKDALRSFRQAHLLGLDETGLSIRVEETAAFRRLEGARTE